MKEFFVWLDDDYADENRRDIEYRVTQDARPDIAAARIAYDMAFGHFVTFGDRTFSSDVIVSEWRDGRLPTRIHFTINTETTP